MTVIHRSGRCDKRDLRNRVAVALDLSRHANTAAEWSSRGMTHSGGKCHQSRHSALRRYT